ncbi:MAG: LLM class F420-dependent oxidoreductase [Deltaproteobacteria bacterium]|nr:LLM class F420-dependent oxidoreductase [Deltaproteobacteria bacterium]
MKFWQSVTCAETEQLCDIARFAEDLGFWGLVGADHALYPKRMSPSYPYSESGLPPQTAESEYPDMWTSFAAMAAVTTNVKFVCGVYVLPVRNPIEVAKQAATLAILSQGRFVLGVGSGWMREEFDIYGIDFASRGRRMDEMIEVMQGLWTGEFFEYPGEFFDFDPIVIRPVSSWPIPIYFGGAAPVALRRAARVGDGWLNTGNTPEEVPAVLAELARLREQAGRADLAFDTLIGVYADPDVDLFRRLEDAGMTSGIHLPFWLAFDGPSTLDQKKKLMEEFAERILRHFP